MIRGLQPGKPTRVETGSKKATKGKDTVLGGENEGRWEKKVTKLDTHTKQMMGWYEEEPSLLSQRSACEAAREPAALAGGHGPGGGGSATAKIAAPKHHLPREEPKAGKPSAQSQRTQGSRTLLLPGLQALAGKRILMGCIGAIRGARGGQGGGCLFGAGGGAGGEGFGRIRGGRGVAGLGSSEREGRRAGWVAPECVRTDEG